MVSALRGGAETADDEDGGGGNSYLPSDVPEEPQLHYQLREKRAEQYKMYIEKVGGMIHKNTHSVVEARGRQEQLSVEVSSFKERAEQKKLEHRTYQQSQRSRWRSVIKLGTKPCDDCGC